MHIKKLIAPIFITALFSFKAQGQTSQGVKFFQQHCEKLLKDGGKWKAKAPTSKYKLADSSYISYFGLEFSKGINSNTIKFRSTGYMPKKSEWKVFSEGYFSWDPGEQKLVSITIWADGRIDNLVSESISENELVMAAQKEKQKSLFKIAEDTLNTTSYVKQANIWHETSTLNFTRLEQPTGNLTFMSTRDGNFEIYSMDTKGENLKNLSCNKAVDYAFSYAPDGRLAFNSNRDGNDEIYIADADGKKQTNITNNPASDRIPVFSPDGKQIVFMSDREEKKVEIYIMDADGKNQKRLTNNGYFEDAGGFSPDGKKIVFSRELKDLKDTSNKAVGNGEIFIMDVDGSNEKQLTFRPGYDGGPQFSPDGTKIAFYGKTAEGNYEIFIMDADGQNIINLTQDPLEDYSPSWSPDGKWIGYTNGNSKNYDAWIINLETKIKTRLTTQPKRDESPFWQPEKK